MSKSLVSFKDTQYFIQSWSANARPGEFVEVEVRLIANVFGAKNVDVESIASALTKSLNNPEVRKAIDKQVGIELDAKRIIEL